MQTQIYVYQRLVKLILKSLYRFCRGKVQTQLCWTPLCILQLAQGISHYASISGLRG